MRCNICVARVQTGVSAACRRRRVPLARCGVRGCRL